MSGLCRICCNLSSLVCKHQVDRMCFVLCLCSVLFVVLSAILYPAFLNLWAIFSFWLLMYVSVMSLLFSVFVCCLFCRSLLTIVLLYLLDSARLHNNSKKTPTQNSPYGYSDMKLPILIIILALFASTTEKDNWHIKKKCKAYCSECCADFVETLYFEISLYEKYITCYVTLVEPVI